MSGRREKMKRANLKLRYIAQMTAWLEQEPPMYRLFAWHRWKRQRPGGWKGVRYGR